MERLRSRSFISQETLEQLQDVTGRIMVTTNNYVMKAFVVTKKLLISFCYHKKEYKMINY